MNLVRPTLAGLLAGALASGLAAPAAAAAPAPRAGDSTELLAKVTDDAPAGATAAARAARYWEDRLGKRLPTEVAEVLGTDDSDGEADDPDDPTDPEVTKPPTGPDPDRAAPDPAAAAGADATVAAVGRLVGFNPKSKKHFHCTAAVVTSLSKSLLLTAGHCVHRGKGGAQAQNLAFVPAYEGAANRPYGVWGVSRIRVMDGWKDRHLRGRDLAFAVVEPRGGRALASVVGANGLVFRGKRRVAVVEIGYPANGAYTGDVQVRCADTTTRSILWKQNKMGCDTKGGASGAPWLRGFDRKTGRGSVMALHSQSPDKLDVCYGPILDGAALRAYDKIKNDA
ncbi:hypothetical protein GCM10010124_10720 [Pilimelia terevasa]|uniref:Serine protease n=1 Tax=Pilimelia terevasa TaxID=53372 RepID=A0A8J3BHH5_9ACTN|nr:hypothetical protein [Pilimelia terevasa]GGK19959.1 hypothetical protein GCM10010124_10720 [Pilimelia terevasa]